MHVPSSTPGPRGTARRPPTYRRHDLVRCDECAWTFLAQGRRVWCPRCGSDRLRALGQATDAP